MNVCIHRHTHTYSVDRRRRKLCVDKVTCSYCGTMVGLILESFLVYSNLIGKSWKSRSDLFYATIKIYKIHINYVCTNIRFINISETPFFLLYWEWISLHLNDFSESECLPLIRSRAFLSFHRSVASSVFYWVVAKKLVTLQDKMI